MPVLREAMRFDPLSEYLGVRTSQAEEIAVVDRGGHSGSPQIGAALRAGICQPDGGAIELCPIIKLPGDDAWYLPLALGARRGDAVDVVFALVPVRSLVAAAQTLQLIPGSWLNFVTADGTRLFRYVPSRDAIEVPSGRTPQEVLDLAARQPAGILELSPLIAAWLKQSIEPGVIFAGMIAVAIFGWQLRAALQRQRRYSAQQEYLANQ
jgi:hypothetical protein